MISFLKIFICCSFVEKKIFFHSQQIIPINGEDSTIDDDDDHQCGCVEDELDFKLPSSAESGAKTKDVPTIGGVPIVPGIDPKLFANILLNIVGVVEDKVKEAMNTSTTSVCKFKPINIFYLKRPYAEFALMISEKEGLDALDKIKNLRDKLARKIPLS